ncbi:MAG: dihydrolipoamide acetyltransferase family protein [Candidatus Promineifilaceae bacterium]|nr:dihydrolipoamide acetyltransferase family protein [Candidatus Promineifilaceae bacterium]
MAHAFELPDLGEGIHEAEILEVLVSPGDTVAEGDIVLRAETDKAAVDVPAPTDGTIEEIRVEPGDIVNVGDPLLTFGDGAEAEAEPEEVEAGSEEAASEDEKAASEAQQAEADRPSEEPSDGRGRPVPASPATRRLARELEVDLQRVEGSGPGGRVTSEDVRSYAQEGPQPEAEAVSDEAEARGLEEAGPAGHPAGLPPALPDLPDFSRWGQVERQALRSVRRTTAKRMTQSWSQIPHVTHHDQADITELEQWRQRTAEELELEHLTLTIFVMKAAVEALKEQPRFNASLDTEARELILKHYYHIGVAVDTERGLIVPVIRDVDSKSVSELAVELAETAARTRDGETTLEDVQGGTFTVTNVGALGGTHFNPIINYPQAAILGMARADWQPTVQDDRESGEKRLEPRLLLPLILAFDHRLVDGADAARFVNRVVALLENPRRLLVEI